MRLGVVGMLPADFRTITPDHLETIQAMNLTAACFHVAPEVAQAVQTVDCQKVKQLYRDMGMNLAQVGINYAHCLFSPDASVRAEAVAIIHRGIEVARMVEADVALIRPGSLNPADSFAPSHNNYAPGCMERLVETLRRVADKAEAEGQTMVVETHALTLMNSPETNVQVVQMVGSGRIRIVLDYVNHFQSLAQVYKSTDRINHIFDVMGAVCPISHCKDISVGNDLTLHLSEELPGEGELDIATALRRWHTLHPTGYMLLEHAPGDKYPHESDRKDAQLLADAPHRGYALAARNVHRIAREAGVPIE